MMYNYYNDYPDLMNHKIYTTQDQIKSVIKQFDTAMIHVGLVRSTDTGQLDTDNIPDLDIKTGLNISGDMDYYRSNGTYLQYLPLLYCFSDTAQTTSPVYIKVLFEIGRINGRYYQNVPPNAEFKYAAFLGVTWQVGNATDGNSNIPNPVTYYAGAYSGTGQYNYNYQVTNHTNYAYQNSVIHFDKEKGILMVNVCPGYRVGTNENRDFVNTTDMTLNNSLVNMLIFRADNETIGTLGYETTGMINTPSPPIRKLFRFITKNKIYNDNNNFAVSGFYSDRPSTVNGKIILTPLNAMNAYTNTMIRVPHILVSSRADTGNNNGMNMNVIINENEKYNYYTYSPIESGFQFTSSYGYSQNLMIYSGTEKYVK